MYNKNLYKEMSVNYTTAEMILFAVMVSDMYDILLKHCDEKKSSLVDYDFERDWWMNKYDELISPKK
jgi:hypothetical protein